jgi:hypothetical protein
VEDLGWNPWRVLRSRRHLDLTWGYLTAGRGQIEDLKRGRRRITLHATLPRRERSEVLGHELLHDEFDLLWSAGTPRALVAKGERFIDQENARRSVPMPALRSYVDRRVASDIPVTVPDVAEEFDVTDDLARRALEMLRCEGQ